MTDWTTKLANTKRFDSRADAEAHLAEVGNMAWGCDVRDKMVGSVFVGGKDHPIVMVEVTIMDGSESRLFLARE